MLFTLQGDCWGCDDEHPCSYMGLDAAPLPSQPELTKLYLHTWERSPFCGMFLTLIDEKYKYALYIALYVVVSHIYFFSFFSFYRREIKL